MTSPPPRPTPTRDPLPLSEQAVDAAIARALSQPPILEVPPDFAGTVAQRALMQPRPPHPRWLGWGPRLALGSGTLLTVALFVLAPHAAPSLSDLRFDAELLFLAELSGLLLFAHKLLPHD